MRSRRRDQALHACGEQGNLVVVLVEYVLFFPKIFVLVDKVNQSEMVSSELSVESFDFSSASNDGLIPDDRTREQLQLHPRAPLCGSRDG